MNTQPASFILNKQHGLTLLLIFAIAFGIRLWAVTAYPVEPVADAADYHRLATGLANGFGYVNAAGLPTAWRPPGYPLFLAAIYVVSGPDVGAATIVQAGVGSVTAILIAVLGFLVAGRRVGVIAGLLAAVYPGFFWLPRVLLSENVSLFLTTAALCCAVMAARNRSWRWALLLGVLLGISILVRGTNLMVAASVIVGFVVLFWKDRVSYGTAAAVVLLTIAGMIVVMAPVTIRNYRLFHRFIPIATQDGVTFYSSYWPPQKDGRLIWGNLASDDDPVVRESLNQGDEAHVSQYYNRVTIQRLRNNPGHFFRLLPSKLISLAAPFDWEWFPHRTGHSRSFNAAYVFILPFALAGAWWLWWRRVADQWLLWIVPISVVIQSVIFYGSPRFRIPAELIAIVMAAVAVSNLYELWITRRTARKPRLPASGTAAGRTSSHSSLVRSKSGSW